MSENAPQRGEEGRDPAATTAGGMLIVTQPDGHIDLAVGREQDASAAEDQSKRSCDVSAPSLQADVLRMTQLRLKLLHMDASHVAQVAYMMQTSTLEPLRRVQTRTVAALVLDALFFLAQYIVMAAVWNPERVSSLALLLPLMLSVVMAGVGMLLVHRHSTHALTAYIVIQAIIIAMLVETSYTLWVSLIVRAVVLVQASYLRFIVGQHLQTLSRFAARAAEHARVRDDLLASVDAFIVLASEALMTVPVGSLEMLPVPVGERIVAARTAFLAATVRLQRRVIRAHDGNVAAASRAALEVVVRAQQQHDHTRTSGRHSHGRRGHRHGAPGFMPVVNSPAPPMFVPVFVTHTPTSNAVDSAHVHAARPGHVHRSQRGSRRRAADAELMLDAPRVAPTSSYRYAAHEVTLTEEAMHTLGGSAMFSESGVEQSIIMVAPPSVEAADEHPQHPCVPLQGGAWRTGDAACGAQAAAGAVRHERISDDIAMA